MRLPPQIIVKEPRTINAWMRPKVTERRQSPEWPGMKQRPSMTALEERPPGVPYH